MFTPFLAMIIQPASPRRLVWLVLLGIVLTGLAVRWSLRSHATPDAVSYLLPWYEYASAHGVAALADGFTNYTPFITYLILGVTKLDGLADPLTLMKAISTPFELACAALTFKIVRNAGGRTDRATAAFAAVWLAPTVLLNGAFWGQVESCWCAFVLLAILAFLRRKNGIPAFGLAFSVKFPAAFLGPWVLGLTLRGRSSWLWLLAVPAIYLGLALPVIVSGRSILDVAMIYVRQAETFHTLSRNAASIWVFLPAPYALGVAVGLALACVAGLMLAVRMARMESLTSTRLLLAAATSLLLMPLLLPKMHERYFYAFEITAIALAFVNPRYFPIAATAQVSGVLAYLVFEKGQTAATLSPAALLNMLMAFWLLRDLWAVEEEERWNWTWRPWLAFSGAALALILVACVAPYRLPLLVLGGLTCVAALDLWRATAPRGHRRGRLQPAPACDT